jgi:hypothetical protein
MAAHLQRRARRLAVGALKRQASADLSPEFSYVHFQARAWPRHQTARCLWIAAPKLPPEMGERMKKLAIKQDEHFYLPPHEILKGGGFAVTIHTETGQPRARSMNRPFSTTWATGYGYGTHSGPANDLYDRYQQIKDEFPELAAKHKQHILAAADQYLDTEPSQDELLKPSAFASVIDLLLNAHALTSDAKYLDRAQFFARMGVKIFLNDGSPLPRATNRHAHYEAITGGPGFMRTLLRLSQAMK